LNLGVDLLCSEQVESISNLSDWHRTVHRIDIVVKHVVQGVTLGHRIWCCYGTLLVLFLDAPLHNLNNCILVLQKAFQLLNLIDAHGHALAELVESVDQVFLVNSKTLNISFISLNVAGQVFDLCSLELNLLVKVDLLLANNVQLINLVVDDALTLLQGNVDLADLSLNHLNLLLGRLYHFIEVLNLSLEVVSKLSSLHLLVHLDLKLLTLCKELSLLLSSTHHGLQEVLNLDKVALSLVRVAINVGHE
jgi:hypothetical protein